MHQYGVRDIEKLLGLKRSAIRALIKAGFVTPQRGPRDAWLFSFQDLIVLRTAQALSASLVPYRRITKALKELRRNLPDEMPLSGLRIAAVGDTVVVKEGDARWQAETGQYLLAFEGDPAAGALNVVEQMPARTEPRHGAERAPAADDALEQHDTNAAIEAYRRQIADGLDGIAPERVVIGSIPRSLAETLQCRACPYLALPEASSSPRTTCATPQAPWDRTGRCPRTSA